MAENYFNTISALYKKYTDYAASQPYNSIDDNLIAPIKEILALQGKKIRPILCLAAYEMFNNEPYKGLDAAHALEIFHNFSLMHDDIMDQAPLRRGLPTTHIKYNVNQAILSGDAMLIIAYQYLLKAANSESAQRIISEFSNTALDVCIGQQQDMDFETRDEVSTTEYLEMNRLKTARLLGFSLQLGAMIGGATPAQYDMLYKYGETVGIAFQIQDDYLDLMGANSGKTKGGDIIRNKKTYLVCKAFEKFSPSHKTELKALLEDNQIYPEQKLAKVQDLFAQYAILETVAQDIDMMFSSADTLLAASDLPASGVEMLRNITNSIQQRDH